MATPVLARSVRQWLAERPRKAKSIGTTNLGKKILILKKGQIPFELEFDLFIICLKLL
ncbi:hypothetical protein GCM10007971_20280 [Oceanobacillus indicireducens]|uniref:Uncharacterized protein n=1 Tax=Oceanobacillus indicireducens TaxID=1004261 RepID=A0A917XZC7_9BACI|nr:hypothetical protein GCM10007971_20280 [Oceanobacillus indicireducens]